MSRAVNARVLTGDCRALLADMAPNSVDAIVTDPPYGLSFMGKGWDRGVPGQEFWEAALRVAKPGAHLAAFGGTRTYHRLACAIEDAGWQIRDQCLWLYGSGFPKSLDVGKAIDALDAPEATHADALTFTTWLRSTSITRQQIREVTQSFMDSHYMTAGSQPAVPTPEHWALMRPLIPEPIPEWVDRMVGEPGRASENLARREVIATRTGKDAVEGDLYRPGAGTYITKEFNITAPHTDAAKTWDGWGTALKPAWEPIIIARKPLAGTVARNVLAHGTGALNIDGCLIGTEDTRRLKGASDSDFPHNDDGWKPRPTVVGNANGRWPANVLLDEEAAALLDEQSGHTASKRGELTSNPGGVYGAGKGLPSHTGVYGFDDAGGASRFFYTSKASRAERNAGLDEIAPRVTNTDTPPGTQGATNPRAGANRSGARPNHHPTVKPLDLMQWLCKLIAPPGGLIVDMFCGSGTTGRAAVAEGFDFLGLELSPEYAEIARARIVDYAPLFMGHKDDLQ
jgi:DNA modification methylase